MKRFGSHTNEMVDQKKIKYTPDNTIKMNKLAAETFRTYLTEKEKDKNFEEYSEKDLADALGTFYLDARSKKGDKYKTSTLENMRHSLNRYLKSPPVSRDLDIITGHTFNRSNEAYKTALRELKESGKGATNHYPMITDTDLTSLYMSVQLAPNTPVGLMNRTQMNIRLYFCRRANENIEKMTKATFKIGKYSDGERYVYKAEDEATKNHKENDKALVTGHMPADLVNEDTCPVNNFIMYLDKLNPKCDRLWQYPRDTYAQDDTIWYQNKPVGRDALSKFMQNLSKAVKLSNVYTNHSIRVTGASILGKLHSAPQIMSVTGHKSTTSLAVYQRVSDEEKRSMGSSISGAIRGNQLALPAPHRHLPLLPPTRETAVSTEELFARVLSDRIMRTATPIEFTTMPGPSNGDLYPPSVSAGQLPVVARALSEPRSDCPDRRATPLAPGPSYRDLYPPSVSAGQLPVVARARSTPISVCQDRRATPVAPRPSHNNSENLELPSDVVDMLFENFDDLPAQHAHMSNVNALTQNQAPSFNNCTFHGLTINFNF